MTPVSKGVYRKFLDWKFTKLVWKYQSRNVPWRLTWSVIKVDIICRALALFSLFVTDYNLLSDSVTLLMTAIPFPYRGLDKEYNTEMASHHPRPKPGHKSYKSHHFSLVLKKHTEWYQKVPLEHCGFECLPFWIYISPIPAWQNLLFKVVHIMKHSL